jgi:hypothetical protein
VPWKLALAQTVALGWLEVSIWLSLPWVDELASAVGIVPAVLVVSLVAYLPGWLVAFLAASLLLDHQPPVRATHPTVPVTVLIAARNEAERIEENDRLHRLPGLPRPRQRARRRQRLHRRHPGHRRKRSAPPAAWTSAASSSRVPARAMRSTPGWRPCEPSWSSPWTPTPSCTRGASASSSRGC